MTSRLPRLLVLAVLVLAGCGGGGFATTTDSATSARDDSQTTTTTTTGAPGVSPAPTTPPVAPAPPGETQGDEPPDPPADGYPVTGTYSGTATQVASGRGEVAYELRMTFSHDGRTATIEYPTLPCSGTLTYVGAHGALALFREQITSGSCDDDGVWAVRQTDDPRAINVNWELEGRNYTVSATLSR